MSIFDEHNTNIMTADTLRMLKTSIDYRDKSIPVSCVCDRLINTIYKWYEINRCNCGEYYTVNLGDICDGRAVDCSIYTEETDHHHPRVYEFIKEMTRRGFRCVLSTYADNITIYW